MTMQFIAYLLNLCCEIEALVGLEVRDLLMDVYNAYFIFLQYYIDYVLFLYKLDLFLIQF